MPVQPLNSSHSIHPHRFHRACGRLLQKEPASWIGSGTLLRLKYSINVTAIDLDKPTVGQVDIPRLRSGHVGGFFWCVD